MLTYPSGLFRETTFWPLGIGMLAPQIFTRVKDSPMFASARRKRGRDPPKF